MARTNRLTPHVLIERRTRRGELVLTCGQQRRGVVFRTPRHGCHRLLSAGEIGGPDVGEGSAAGPGQLLSHANDCFVNTKISSHPFPNCFPSPASP